jgi:hypothetical protein
LIKGSVGLELLLPHLVGVVVEAVEQAAHRIRIMVRGKAEAVVCGGCGSASRRVHSRYTGRWPTWRWAADKWRFGCGRALVLLQRPLFGADVW